SVAIVDDPTIHALNREHLAHDYPTDVISFGLRDPDDPDPLLGEVVVSADRARAEAKARGIGADEELLRYVVHGTLHLLGHDDQEPRARARMHRKQEAVLAKALAGPAAAGRRGKRPRSAAEGRPGSR
ncbi:MAG TPA: rRNA maturation RNase YbeY, partial [Planctomycetota bacterium]|nr:rRNA maturation RNase YbeY [Planctomycetota bacterium]